MPNNSVLRNSPISEVSYDFRTRRRAFCSPQLRAQPVTALWAHLEVLDEIGRGSSGVVYRAFDPMLNRAVALKVRNPENGHADDLLRDALVDVPFLVAVPSVGEDVVPYRTSRDPDAA